MWALECEEEAGVGCWTGGKRGKVSEWQLGGWIAGWMQIF